MLNFKVPGMLCCAAQLESRFCWVHNEVASLQMRFWVLLESWVCVVGPHIYVMEGRVIRVPHGF